MRIQLVLLLSLLLIGQSCTKENLFRSYCINERLKEYKKDNCPGASVKAYYYIGRKVYIFDPGPSCYKEPVTVLDKSCKVICYVGGWGATPDCEGKNFYNKAIFKVTIWKN